MSKKKHRDINETPNNDVSTNVKGDDKDMNEKDENKGFFYKVGEGIGKGVNGITTFAKSKGAKAVAVTLMVAGAAKAGYEYGKTKTGSCEDPDESAGSISDESSPVEMQTEE